MGKGQRQALTLDRPDELKATKDSAEDLEGLVPAVMAANSRVGQVEEVRKPTGLGAVPRCHQNAAVTPLQLLNYRSEERDMRGVVQVDPDITARRKQVSLHMGNCKWNVRLVALSTHFPVRHCGDPEVGDLLRQGMPVFSLEPGTDMFQKLLVVHGRICLKPGLTCPEMQVVGVDYDDYHASPIGEPVELAFPDEDVFFPQDQEKGVVLWEGIWQFHVPRTAAPSGDPAGEDGAKGIGLGLEGVCVEGGRVVGDVQVRDPIQVVVHGGGAEAHGPPFLEIPVDPAGLALEGLPGFEHVPVVGEAVEPHLEALIPHLLQKVHGDRVLLGNEVERRAEAQVLLHLHERTAVGHAPGPLHVVGEDQGELLAIRPALPARRRVGGPWIDGPDVGYTLQLPSGIRPPQSQLNPAGNQGFVV